MRPNFVKLSSVAVDHDPGLVVLGVPSKLSFVVAVQGPAGAGRRARFFASLRVW